MCEQAKSESGDRHLSKNRINPCVSRQNECAHSLSVEWKQTKSVCEQEEIWTEINVMLFSI